MSIRNPVEWGVDQFRQTIVGIGTVNRGIVPVEDAGPVTLPGIRRIGIADLKEVLARGYDDFGANRTDVVFLCVIYPVVGVLLIFLTAGHALLPLLFPLASGFALVGPFAGVGLNEMSRRRELGIGAGWSDAFRVLQSPSIGAIFLLGFTLTMIFLLWQLTAFAIYELTLGPQLPASASAFAYEVFQTGRGWVMIVFGIGIGFAFAVVVLVVSSVAFPLLLDREVGVQVAVTTSVRAALANPVPILAWGAIIAGGLVIGSIPFFIGLAVVLPVLGHSTWHLYRKVVVMPP
jgi:uncharacterized membrane protein